MTELVADLADTEPASSCWPASVVRCRPSSGPCRTPGEVGRNRPIVVTGYVGLVYERAVDGLLLRAGADLVLANSAVDAQQFRSVLAAVDADPDSVVAASLPFLSGRPYDPTAAGRDRPFTTTFVTQPGVPETRDERRYAMAAGCRAREHQPVASSDREAARPAGRAHHPRRAAPLRDPDAEPPVAGQRRAGLRLDGRCARPDRSVRDRELHCGHRGHAPPYPHRDPHRLRHPGIPGKPGLPRLGRLRLVGRAARRRGAEARPGLGREQRRGRPGSVRRSRRRIAALAGATPAALAAVVEPDRRGRLPSRPAGPARRGRVRHSPVRVGAGRAAEAHGHAGPCARPPGGPTSSVCERLEPRIKRLARL